MTTVVEVSLEVMEGEREGMGLDGVLIGWWRKRRGNTYVQNNTEKQ